MHSLKNIDLRLLECFDVLVRECSVTLAAERLQMSQGNMSNSLGRLRELLDDPLLVRSARGMTPTERALELRPQVQDLIQRLQGFLETRTVEEISTVHRSVKIACADATALFALGPLIEEVRQIAPNLQIEVSQILNFRVKEPLDDGSLDLAIGAYLDLSDVLQVSRLLTGKMLCVVRSEGDNATAGITLDRYCDAAHAILSVGHGFRATVEMITDQVLADLGRSRTVRLSSQYVTVIADAVSRSDLITTMPDFMIHQFAHRMPLIGVAPPMELPDYALSVVWHPRTKGDWVLSWFRRRLREHLVRAQNSAAGSGEDANDDF